MSDWAPGGAFENRLYDLIHEYGDGAVRPFDATIIVATAIAGRPAGGSWRARHLAAPRLGDQGRAMILVAAALGAILAASLIGALVFVAGQHRALEARLIFVRAGNIYRAAAGGSDPTQIVAGDQKDAFGLGVRWAPRGRRFAAATSDHLAVFADDGRLLASFPWTWSGLPQYAWAPDGTRLAMLSQGGPLQIVNVDGSPTTRLALPANFGFAYDLSNISWSPDGRTIAFTGCGGCQPKSGPSVLWIEHIDGSGLTSLVGEPFDYGPTWAPDGSLLFGQGKNNAPRGLMRVDPDGSGYRQIFAHNEWLGTIEPSPDGRRVLLGGNPNTVMTVNADGSEPVVASPRSGSGLKWSADGQRLLTATASGLMEFDPDGGHPVMILPNVDAFDLGGSQ